MKIPSRHKLFLVETEEEITEAGVDLITTIHREKTRKSMEQEDKPRQHPLSSRGRSKGFQ